MSDETVGWPLQTLMGSLEGLWCQEVVTANEFMEVNCRQPAVCMVWSDKRIRPMCLACGSHNVMNRRVRLVVDGTPGGDLLREVARRGRPPVWRD